MNQLPDAAWNCVPGTMQVPSADAAAVPVHKASVKSGAAGARWHGHWHGARHAARVVRRTIAVATVSCTLVAGGVAGGVAMGSIPPGWLPGGWGAGGGSAPGSGFGSPGGVSGLGACCAGDDQRHVVVVRDVPEPSTLVVLGLPVLLLVAFRRRK